MLFFAWPPFKTHRSHLNDINFFLHLADFWLLFRTLKDPNRFLAFLVPRLGPQNLEINLGIPPKVLRKAPYQLAVFWPNFWTRNARNSIKGSENAYSALESKNTASQNIGVWDRWWRHIINQKTCPCHDPIGPKPPNQILKKVFFILNYTTPLVITGFEQLSSSICCRLMAAKVCPERANYAFSEKFWSRPKTGFLIHNFG